LEPGICGRHGVVTKSEREMKEMMRNLGKYVRKKKREVNVEKIKMIVFNRRKRKSEESEWKWEDRKSERVQVFGLHFQRESHGQGASEGGSEEGEQGSWMCVGNRRENVGR
jgi:hypothetical protein